MKKTNYIDNGNHYLVNARYAIYKDDGCIYNTINASDIPQNIFALRDKLVPDRLI